MEEWEKRLEEGEMLIRQFYRWLHARKIVLMNPRPIEEFNDFISGYTDHRLDEVTPADLKRFLYDFYIRKCNPDVDPLTPLLFFSQFLTDKGVVKNNIPFQTILNDKGKYRKRIISYPSAELPECQWHEQYFEWGLLLNDELAEEIVQDDDLKNLPTLHNFASLLRYVKENEIRLTPANSYFRLSDIRRLDELFIVANRPFTKGICYRPHDYRTEEDYLYFYYLDTMARVAKYLKQRKGRLHLTHKGHYYLNLSPSAQYLRLFCIYWHEINWGFLYDHPASEQFQRFQQDLECIFRDFIELDEVNMEKFCNTIFSELDIRPVTDSSEYFSIFARQALQFAILDWLEEFGIILGRRQKNLKDPFAPKIVAFCITPLGRRVIEHFFTLRDHS